MGQRWRFSCDDNAVAVVCVVAAVLSVLPTCVLVLGTEDSAVAVSVYPNTFSPSSIPEYFSFEGSPVNITNATTEAEACGFVCPGRVDGEVIDGVLGLFNASSPSNGIRMTAMCWLVVGNTTSETQVCTAFIRYNASYVENGTVYALPVNRTVTLDPRTRVIARGYTFPLWLWIEMSVCPWYYSDPAVLLQPSSWERAMEIDLDSSNSSSTNHTRSFYLVTWLAPQCDVLPNPNAGGSMRVRITVFVTAPSVRYQWRFLPPPPHTSSNTTPSSQRPGTVVVGNVFVSKGLTPLSNNTSGEITVLDLMNVSMSSWQPMENYSEAPLATQPRRCYSTQPRATDGSPSTVWADRTACTVYPGYVVRLDIEILNATALCCSVPNATSPVVWSSPIEVWVSGARWFFDNAGIAADPSPTAVPGSGEVPPRNWTNSSAPSAQPDAATEAPVGGRVGSSAGGGESAALVIGAVLAAVCAVVAVGAVLYTVVWKRYRAAQSSKEQRDDALLAVMERHGADEDVIGTAAVPGMLEAELLSVYRDGMEL